jgi:hypothetical protein
MDAPDQDQYSPEETEQRVRKALRGAFRGSPTQLKDIPRKSRASRVKAASAATSKSARQAT